jgi:hypothetical protein
LPARLDLEADGGGLGYLPGHRRGIVP